MIVTHDRDIAGAAAAAERVVSVHQRIVEFLQPGQTLAQIDSFIATQLADLQCRSCFLGYKARGHPPFPSQACLSVNACVVHGTHVMNRDPLAVGDILSVDIGVLHDGWIGDAAWTYAIREASDDALALMRCGRESLRRGVAAMRPGRPLVDFAKAVQTHVETECGYCLVRGLGGHGYGRTLHESPFISNVVPSYPGEWEEAWQTYAPGMLIAVEPMLARSTTEITSHGTAWPIFSADGSLTTHYEADVLITAHGPRNLTQGLFELPEIVGAAN